MSHAPHTSVDAQPTEERLSRRLGVVSLTALLLGVVIGSGIFRTPSLVAAQVGSLGGIAVIWIAGALVSLTGAVPIMAVTTALPRPGGAYVALKECYGPLVAFLYGWFRMVVTGPAALAALALIFAEYARTFVSLTDTQVHFVAAGVVVALTAASIASVPWGVALQNVSSWVKVVALAVLAVLIFALGEASRGAFSQVVVWRAIPVNDFWTAFIAVLFTYTGWVEFTYLAGEVRDPARTYPRALFGGMAIVIVVYLLINAAYLYVLPMDEMAKSSLVAATAATAAIGPRAAAFIAALVMLSSFGAINAAIMASPRVSYAMAKDGLLFRSIGSVRRGTPHMALLLNLVLGLTGVFTHTFEQLARIFVLGRWPFIALAVGTVFVVPRRRPDLAPLCRRWGYPFVPAAFIVFSVVMLTNELVRRPADLLPSLGIVVAGIVVYYGSRAWSTWRATAVRAAADAAR